ncbi:MAG: DNA adenine methylase [Planctomycetota bacterium]
MQSPVKWFGGKSAMASMIAKLFPPHRIYVEVFGGGGSVLFGKEPSPVEVYNDLDSGLVNFFRVLRDQKQAAQLYFLASRTPYSREEYLHARDGWRTETDPVSKAHLWYITMRMGYGALMNPSNGWSRSLTTGRDMAQCTQSFLGSNARLAEACDRLSRVQIEQRDFRELIDAFDTEQTVFYIDPPYVPDTRRGGEYDHELSDEDHHDLVSILLKLKGHAILSGYATEIYDPLLKAGWKLRTHAKLCKIGFNTQRAKLDPKKAGRVECLWLSPAIKVKRRRSHQPKPCLARRTHATLARGAA